MFLFLVGIMTGLVLSALMLGLVLCLDCDPFKDVDQ